MAEPTHCTACNQPVVDAEPGLIIHAPALFDALEEVLEEFDDHQFERARAVVARARGEPEETAIRKFDAILNALAAQDWDGAHGAIDDVISWLDTPGAYVPTAGIERAREALSEPDRPSCDDLLALVNDVALGNTGYDTLSNLAHRLIEGREYAIGANDDDDQTSRPDVGSVSDEVLRWWLPPRNPRTQTLTHGGWQRMGPSAVKWTGGFPCAMADVESMRIGRSCSGPRNRSWGAGSAATSRKRSRNSQTPWRL